MRYVAAFDPSPGELKEFDYNVIDTDGGYDITIAWCALKSDAERIAGALNSIEAP